MQAQHHLKLIESIVELLDNKFSIGKFRFGLDPILGLVPGIGDLLPVFISGYLIIIGISEKISKKVIVQMVVHTILDVVIGSVPIIGDAADFFYKSHQKNLQLLKQELNIPIITNSNNT